MNSLVVVALAAGAFYLAFRFYSAHLGRRVLALDAGRPTPAQQINDGVDYVPTRPSVLFGHHFASIAGLGPIVGPAIAVVWGWLPALLWVVLGSIFIGAVHDFAVLGISMRHRGRTIGDIADEVLGPRARILFMLIILFAIALAMGVFALIISDLFSYFGADPAAQVSRAYPEAVIPSVGLIIVAVITGYLIHRRSFPFAPTVAVGVAVMFALLAAGIAFPLMLEAKQLWIWLLLGYAFVASVLPVWLLLQPRDFLSSFNLYAMLALLAAAFIWGHPQITAPALRTEALGDPGGSLPALFPFLFITVACGAVSGFHCMVSSGTTSKQIRSEADARAIGYGGMITEGFLAVIVIMACAAGYSAAEWGSLYKAGIGGTTVGVKIGAFVDGAANIAASIGIPLLIGKTFLAVTIVAFALTTLDSGTRLIRYTIEELARIARLPSRLNNRFVASALAVGVIGYFALMQIDGRPAGLALWKLFGTSNQLLAGIALLVATVYFFKQRRPTVYTFLPMLFMLSITTWALALSLQGWLADPAGNMPLIVVGGIIVLLLAWLIVEAAINFSAYRSKRRSENGLAASGSRE